jgi:ferredoxin
MRCVPVIDAGACIAQGDCAEIAPEIFEVGDVTVRVAGEAEPDLLIAAAEACPTGAITVIDADSGEQIFP